MSMRRASPALCAACAVLLAVLPAAAADCSVAQTGSLRGLLGVHTQSLRPGRRTLSLAVPPVCEEQNGIRAMVCEMDDGAGEADGAGGANRDMPLVELAADGRRVTVRRSDSHAGFAVLSLEVYCADDERDDQ